MSEMVNLSQENHFSNSQDLPNPFPGLRPFELNESHLFFGREGQSEEVLKNLSRKKFVAVIGASGSGKSSLMYCGLTPILHGGFITRAGSNWRIISTRPGSSPIQNLSKSLVNSEKKHIEENNIPLQEALFTSLLKSSSRGLEEVVERLHRHENENILLLVDQFEELFRFKKSNNDIKSFNESLAYVEMLLDVIKQDDLPIYIVLTMRSDFIGECAHFQELTSLINESHYLIPQMTRADLNSAITGPIAVGGGKIEPRLVQQLLNEIGDNQDQLPILQHALMRTWNYWQKHRIDKGPIDIEHYEAIGKMDKALSDHANEAYDELSSKGKEISETLFKALTERGADNRGIRRPSNVSEVAAIAGTSESEVIEVIDKFRSSDRSFLTSANKKLSSKSTIDISHESLMRIWDRLIVWVEEEADAVQMYLRLSEAAALYQEGKTGLWRPPDLQLGINWKKKQKPTLTWAQRYNPAFERTLLYLQSSEKAFKVEELMKMRAQKRALKRTRLFALVLGIATIVAIGVMLYAFMQQIEAKKQTKEAEKQKELADNEKKKADHSALRANYAKKEAEINLEEANKQKSIANQQTIFANQQTSVANLKSIEAEQQALIAEAEKRKSEYSAHQATLSAQSAKKASLQAQDLRMLSIAQSMAVKSLQIKQEIDRKHLVAYQGFLFNKKHGGSAHNPDIYDGLYAAIKSKNKPGFNVMKGHKSSVVSMQFLDDKMSLITAESKGKVLKWNIANDLKTNSILFDGNLSIRSMATSNNHIALGTQSSTISLVNIKNGSVKQLLGHKGMIWSLSFTPNQQKIISSGADSTVLIWDIEKGTSTVIAKCKSVVKSITISPNGNYIIGGTDQGEIIMWDLNNANKSTSLAQDVSNNIRVVRFSNNGKYIATGNKFGVINIYRFPSGKLETSLVGHSARINDLKFSPKDKYLASASFDRTVRLFLTSDFDLSPIVLRDHEAWVWSLAFTEDEEKIITGVTNGEIMKYPTNTDALVDDICNSLHRNMTEREWNKYVAKDIPLEKTCKKLPLNNE